MHRKATKNTRGPNALEKRFQGWIKQRPCCWCGSESGSIVDHVKGSTFRHNKELIGHIFVLPNCYECDKRKTFGGEKLGDYADAWLSEAEEFEISTGEMIPFGQLQAIKHWGGTWQNGRL